MPTPFPAGKTMEVEGFPNYVVSVDGEIFNKVTGKKVKVHFDSLYKYPTVELYAKPKDKKRRTVHRIVATAFCEGKADGLHVNHKNGIKTDNRAANLEWVTGGENQKHSFRVLGRKIITTPIVQLDLDGRVIKVWASMKEAGEKLGIPNINNTAAVIGKMNTRGGFRWRRPTEQELRLLNFFSRKSPRRVTKKEIEEKFGEEVTIID